jgi:hypothetical protein
MPTDAIENFSQAEIVKKIAEKKFEKKDYDACMQNWIKVESAVTDLIEKNLPLYQQLANEDKAAERAYPLDQRCEINFTALSSIVKWIADAKAEMWQTSIDSLIEAVTGLTDDLKRLAAKDTDNGSPKPSYQDALNFLSEIQSCIRPDASQQKSNDDHRPRC